MKTICAWCGKLMNDGKVGENGEVSHGICLECKESVLQKELRNFKKRLDNK